MTFVLETLGEVGEAWLILIGLLLMITWTTWKGRK